MFETNPIYFYYSEESLPWTRGVNDISAKLGSTQRHQEVQLSVMCSQIAQLNLDFLSRFLSWKCKWSLMLLLLIVLFWNISLTICGLQGVLGLPWEWMRWRLGSNGHKKYVLCSPQPWWKKSSFCTHLKCDLDCYWSSVLYAKEDKNARTFRKHPSLILAATWIHLSHFTQLGTFPTKEDCSTTALCGPHSKLLHTPFSESSCEIDTVIKVSFTTHSTHTHLRTIKHQDVCSHVFMTEMYPGFKYALC